uniref:Uncharacterized protein n=1 Tax=Rangifer tarandus platyrhynchus TaxID=3082113 RepID=A0ACB0E807_RANTA|nr:unnamed protein product [Rangifer tarandus platyrhynchus]
MGQQAVFTTDKQLSGRQAQLRGAEVDRGGASVWGVWCVPVVCWGGECATPHPCLSFPFPFLVSQLPVEETGALRGRRGGGSWKGGEKEAGAKGPAPGETEGVRKEMPLHTSTRVCTAHVPNTELARWQLPGTGEPALSQAPGDLACGPASA